MTDEFTSLSGSLSLEQLASHQLERQYSMSCNVLFKLAREELRLRLLQLMTFSMTCGYHLSSNVEGHSYPTTPMSA